VPVARFLDVSVTVDVDPAQVPETPLMPDPPTAGKAFTLIVSLLAGLPMPLVIAHPVELLIE
jgi:hypothetical protein